MNANNNKNNQSEEVKFGNNNWEVAENDRFIRDCMKLGIPEDEAIELLIQTL